jgi:outer membrane protein TolC
MSRVLRLASVALLACAAAGCRGVDHDAEIATWRSVIDRDAPPKVEAFAPDEPLTLSRALELANHDNETLALHGEDYLQALIDKKRQVAELFPVINLAPTYFAREAGNLSGPLGQNQHVDVPLQATYTNFLPYSQVASVYRAATTIDEKRAILLDVKASILLQVAGAYYDVLRSERSVEVLANSLEVQEERVRDVEAQNVVGFARALDVAQARAQAAATRVLLVQARSNVRNNRSALALLMGVELMPGVNGLLVDRFEVPETVDALEALQERALAHRQDYAAAQSSVQAAYETVDVAVGQYYPSINLNLQYFLYRETIPADSLYSALVQANIPIFTFGKIRADVRTAWSQFRQAKLTESQTRRQVADDVKTGYENLVTSGVKIGDLHTEVAAAQDAFDQASDLLRVGKATNLERLVAQDQLLAAQLLLSSEEFNRKVAYLALLRACGELDLGAEHAAPAHAGP